MECGIIIYSRSVVELLKGKGGEAVWGVMGLTYGVKRVFQGEVFTMSIVKDKVVVALWILLLSVTAFAQTHFNPPSSNYQPMNIYIIDAKLNGTDLVSGDEVAAYDGSTCAGTQVVDHVATSSNPISMIAYQANGSDAGFAQGNTIIFKCWDASLALEHTFSSGEVQFYDPATGNPISAKKFEGLASIMVSLNGSQSGSTYTLVMQTTTGGSTSPTPGSYNYANGSTVNIQALPNAGYQFEYWEGSVANPNSASTTVTMSTNKTVIAHFKCVQYTLTLSVNLPGTGSTTPSPGDHLYCQGSEVIITALPATGYEFVNWSGGAVADANSASTLVYISGNKSVTANFRAVTVTNYTLTMQVNQSGWGSTSPAVGTSTYPANQVVNISATPAAGYAFVNWTGDVASPNSAATTVTMSTNKTVTANFQRSQYTLTMEVNQSGWGSTTPTVGTYTYDSGSVVSILAEANSGYRFVNWTGEVANATSASTTVTMNSAKTVRANFERIQYNLIIQSSSGGSTSPVAGTYAYDSGSVVTISATANSGYHFVRWNGEVTDAFTASTTVVMSAAKTISATFASNGTYSLTINISPTGGGTTSPAAGTASYASGTTVTVTATANSGYHFVNWTGDASGTTASVTMTMTSNKTITANFAQNAPTQRTLTMQVNQSAWGSTDPAVGNHQYNENTNVTVKALPATGYRFVNWNGPVASSTSSTTTVYMDGDKTVTANFEPVPRYTLTMQTDPAGGVGGTTTPPSGDSQYDQNTQVTLQASSKTGYRFDHWQGEVASTSNPTTSIVMSGNKTVIAFFVAIPQYSITVQPPANPSMGYTTPGAGTYVLYQNETMTLKAFANSGYRFLNWNNDPSLASTTITITADGNKSYTPIFELINDVTLKMEVDDPLKGSVFPAVGTHTYKQGELVTIEATPTAGYRFVEWQIDGTKNNYFSARMTITMDKNKTVRAFFDNISYRLIMDVAPPEGGTTNPVKGTSEHKSWSTVTISATPAAGYKFTGWTGNVAQPENATTTVMMSGDQQVCANFAQTGRYTLNMNASPSNGGVTDPSIGPHEYPLGQVVNLTAMPATGFVFQEWEGGVANPSSATTTIQINSDKNVTAVFQEKPPDSYQLTLKVNPTSGGTTTPAPSTYTYSAGQVVTITALPAASYHFDSWSGDVFDVNAMTTTVTMNANKTVTANFAPGASEYKFTIGVEPTGAGATKPPIGSYYYAQGTIIQIEAIPTAGNVFDYWSGDVAEPNSSATTVTINADKGVIAHFRPQTTRYSLTMAVNPEGGGTVIPAAGQYGYDANTTVTIQAQSAAGYEFVNWSGVINNPTSPTTTILMDGNKTATANFRQKANEMLLTMQIDPAGGGNVGPEVGTHVFSVNEKIYITAVANPGYQFSHWTGDVDNPDNATTFIIMNSNKTITAHFVLGQPQHATLTIYINPLSSGTTQPAEGSYEYSINSVVTIQATPAQGYRFVGWNGEVASPLSATTTVTMSTDKTVYANFEREGSGMFVLSMNVSPVGTGTTAPSPGISMHSPGAIVNISAIPYEGYFFVGWHGEVEDTTKQTTQVVIDKNKEVYAKFDRVALKQVNLVIMVYPQNSGVCMPSEGTHAYNENTFADLLAIPNPGFVFKSWTGDVENPTSQSTRIMMNGNKTVIATFESVAPNQVTLTMAVNPAETGYTDPGEGGHAYTVGQVVPLVAVPQTGYRFVNWSGGVADPANPITTVTMTENKVVTANFQVNRFTVVMAVNPQGSGSTIPSVGDTTVAIGANLTVSARAAAGYRFAYWSGDLSGDQSPITIKVEKNLQIIANFVVQDETITTPKIYSITSAFRKQMLDVFVRNAASSLGHNLEYQFEWGDGATSPWVDLSSQKTDKITTFTTPVGGSGLPNVGYLVNYQTGEATPVQLSVSGGIFSGKQDAWLGEEPAENTDAADVFGGIVQCRGAISFVDSPSDELKLDFSGLNPGKVYTVVFYSNRNEFGWVRSSLVTLSGADSFLNLSSVGSDELGNPLFNGNFSPNTRLPADNTTTGYVAKFANIAPGSDGSIALSVRFSGKIGNEYKGKYGSTVMLQEINPLTQQPSFSAYDDLAWDGNYYSHAYSAAGSYLVRMRARCKNHNTMMSGWSNTLSVLISGCVLTTNMTEGANAVINRTPDHPDYDYGAQVTVLASAGKNWVFSYWNDDSTDTLAVKLVYVNNSKLLKANFRLQAEIKKENDVMPETFALQQNFPNPFNPTTEIRYDLPQPEYVTIDIFDVRGRWVTTLVDMQMPAGSYKVIWDAVDSAGTRMPTGLYFYKMTAGSFREIRRMVLLK
jgi:uncharacterized repeat protein (TIGR02543 family)